MRGIHILPAVLQDVVEAAKWYDKEGYPGLGDRFAGTFYDALLHIQRNGEIHRVVFDRFRKVLIRPFPYSVFYRLQEEVWIVALVMHAARRPTLAKAALRERA